MEFYISDDELESLSDSDYTLESISDDESIDLDDCISDDEEDLNQGKIEYELKKHELDNFICNDMIEDDSDSETEELFREMINNLSRGRLRYIHDDIVNVKRIKMI